MKISAMILVGDNEPYLDYCIASIKDLVDEIVYINDKGKVDFAKWRNKALKQITGDWVLYIDADEVLAKPDGKNVTRKEMEMLIHKADEEGIHAYNIFTLHFLYNYRLIDGRNNGNHFSVSRFFRRDDVIKYIGRIHELPQFKATPKIANIKHFWIYHFGHCKGMEDLRNKYRMSMQIDENPFRPHFVGMTPDQYCATHELFRMSRPIIFYDGHLPKVMKLW